MAALAFPVLGPHSLFAIPGQDCFYEMTITDLSTVVAGWAFDSLRFIEGTEP